MTVKQWIAVLGIVALFLFMIWFALQYWHTPPLPNYT
jgi:TRAP-type C4-dicarboxylate transport system permease small subunit